MIADAGAIQSYGAAISSDRSVDPAGSRNYRLLQRVKPFHPRNAHREVPPRLLTLCFKVQEKFSTLTLQSKMVFPIEPHPKRC